MVFKYLVAEYKKAGKSLEENAVNSVRSLLLNESLSCAKCDSLSVPIYATANKYRCVKCGRQFSGTSHYIHQRIDRKHSSYSQKYYRMAVEQIRS